jgi:hypothetical protein
MGRNWVVFFGSPKIRVTSRPFAVKTSIQILQKAAEVAENTLCPINPSSEIRVSGSGLQIRAAASVPIRAIRGHILPSSSAYSLSLPFAIIRADGGCRFARFAGNFVVAAPDAFGCCDAQPTGRGAGVGPVRCQDLRRDSSCADRSVLALSKSPQERSRARAHDLPPRNEYPFPMKAAPCEAAVPSENPLFELRGNSRDLVGANRLGSAVVRWAWRLVNFRSLTPARFPSRTPRRSLAAPLASYCGRKRRIARPCRLSPRRLTEKRTSNQPSQRTLGNRPSTHDPVGHPFTCDSLISNNGYDHMLMQRT